VSRVELPVARASQATASGGPFLYTKTYSVSSKELVTPEEPGFPTGWQEWLRPPTSGYYVVTVNANVLSGEVGHLETLAGIATAGEGYPSSIGFSGRETVSGLAYYVVGGHPIGLIAHCKAVGSLTVDISAHVYSVGF